MCYGGSYCVPLPLANARQSVQCPAIMHHLSASLPRLSSGSRTLAGDLVAHEIRQVRRTFALRVFRRAAIIALLLITSHPVRQSKGIEVLRPNRSLRPSRGWRRRDRARLLLGFMCGILPMACGCGMFRAMGRGLANSTRAVASACHRVTPEEEQDLEDAKSEIGSVLDCFEEGVREDDLAKLTDLLSPILEARARQEVETEIRDAIRTWAYSDYKLFYDEAVDTLKWRHTARGRVALNLGFRTHTGNTLKDRFVFRRFRGKWLIGDVHLRQPRPSDPLDLDTYSRARIMAEVGSCVAALRAGDEGFGTFLTAFEERERFRRRGRDLETSHASLMTVVQFLFGSAVRDIQFSPERSRIHHHSGGRVYVPVPITCKYPPESPEPFEQVEFAFFFVERGGDWVLVDLKTLKERSWFRSLF